MDDARRVAERPHRTSRRTLLGAFALAMPLIVLPHIGRAAVPSRRLSFHHTHTNEKFSLVYYSRGAYVRESLEVFDHLLRDFRTGEVRPIDPALFDILFETQRLTGSRGMFEVISGFRSPTTNKKLRAQDQSVAKRSLHMVGRAVDVRLTDLDTAQLRDAVWTLGRGGVGYYQASDFVHIDTGSVRRW